MTAPVLLRSAGVAVLLDTDGPQLPRVLHWGADPGPLDADALARLAADLVPGRPHAGLDEPWPFPLLPTEVDGWAGRAGLAGHREGRHPFPRLALAGVASVTTDADGAHRLTATAADAEAGLEIVSEMRLEAGGLLRVRHTVTNSGDGRYTLQELLALLPVPGRAGELLDLTGRWCRERSPQRRPLAHGALARESRRGRTGHDATLVLVAGTPGFGWRRGEVWGVHVAWSGDHVHLAERLPEGAGAGGAGVLGGGELLLPGEIRLAEGESYTTPWVVFTYSDAGLDGASGRIHHWLRARPGHPRRPRPLVLNTWEAVYFDQSLEKLTALAEQASRIGVERFVVDDGWFGSRRDDTSGLGDWYIATDVWPQGLRPLADGVRALGMEFGLWVEPEMANPDSDVVRAHPDWVLGPAARAWRGQVVLDVARPDAYAYLLERISALVDEIGIAYLKWDHNRDLHEAVGTTTGAAGVHAQTGAVYKLLDELRRRHPGLENESCASGGARVDRGILERTDRVWASDTNDPVERQLIQRWTGLLLPPELVGAHVGPPVAHTTHRPTSLGMRTITALFGHAGLAWDVTTCSDDEALRLAAWAGLYKELRGLLHGGDVVRADDPDPGVLLHGVVAADRREALFAYVPLETGPEQHAGRLVLPGLDPDLVYDVTRRDDAGVGQVAESSPPDWWARGSATASGGVLERIGLPAPRLDPANAVVVHLRAR
ncbi:MAG: alpha-galactosidase [Kineosporiaceae bacterium]